MQTEKEQTLITSRNGLFHEKAFGELMDLSTELSENMTEAFLLQVADLQKTHEIALVYGDILKTILALRDYAEIMEQVCDEWNLEGFHRAIYELRAKNLKEISQKLETGVGFHYDAAMQKCERRKKRRKKDNGVGEDALVLASKQHEQSFANEQATNET